MTNEELPAAQPLMPPVTVKLTKASTKDGNEGYELRVEMGATALDVKATITNALDGRKQLIDALWPPIDPGSWPSTRDEG